MLKKMKVVMLPTNEKAAENQICINNVQMFKWTKQHDKVAHTLVEYRNTKAQHLYFLSDEEIKEGDWVIREYYPMNKGFTRIVEQFIRSKADFGDSLSRKKIIATTDNSLKIKVRDNYVASGYIENYLPQPSQSFIEKYFEKYNKGEQIAEVMVEYEEFRMTLETETKYPEHLKVNPKDNTITIKPVKDSWNREELDQLMNHLLNDVLCKLDKDSINFRRYPNSNKIAEFIINWIKQNL